MGARALSHAGLGAGAVRADSIWTSSITFSLYGECGSEGFERLFPPWSIAESIEFTVNTAKEDHAAAHRRRGKDGAHWENLCAQIDNHVVERVAGPYAIGLQISIRAKGLGSVRRKTGSGKGTRIGVFVQIHTMQLAVEGAEVGVGAGNRRGGKGI